MDEQLHLTDLPGRTIKSVERTSVPGAYGDEPCIVLHFTDGSQYGFVLPSETGRDWFAEIFEHS